ncbi:MAG: helix-turn-helix domain-containing protein, partial [Spirochaetia bacterium]
KSNSRSLDMHISHLRRKLRVVTAPDPAPVIEVERGRGYVLSGWQGKPGATVVK